MSTLLVKEIITELKRWIDSTAPEQKEERESWIIALQMIQKKTALAAHPDDTEELRAAFIKELKTAIGRALAEWATRDVMNVPQVTLAETLFAVIDDEAERRYPGKPK
jgi:hypothetical protein